MALRYMFPHRPLIDSFSNDIYFSAVFQYLDEGNPPVVDRPRPQGGVRRGAQQIDQDDAALKDDHKLSMLQIHSGL
jgi:hypothetical protein